MPNMFVRTDVKTWRFFATKWAEATKVSAGTFKRNLFTNHVLDIQPRPNFLFGILHNIIIPLLGHNSKQTARVDRYFDNPSVYA